MRLTFAIEPPREERARVIARLVEGLAGDDDPAFLRVHDERLMAVGVAGGRDDANAARDLGLLAVQDLEHRSWKVDRLLRQRVIERRARGVTLGLLDEDRRARKTPVVARMVDVQVTVRDRADLARLHAHLAQRVVEVADDRMEERLGLRVPEREAGVEQDRAVGMSNEEGRHDDHRPLQVRRARKLHRHGVVALMDADDIASPKSHLVRCRRRRGRPVSVVAPDIRRRDPVLELVDRVEDVVARHSQS